MLRRIAVLVLLLGILPAVSHALPRALPLGPGPDAPAAGRAAEGWLAHLGRLLGGATHELKALALDLLAAFEAREIHRESTAVLILFHRACEEDRLTADLAR